MATENIQTANCAKKEKKKRILSPLFRKPTQKERGCPKFLTENQVNHLIQVAQNNGAKRVRKRNTLLLMMLFRHGLRRNEARYLRWDQINIEDSQLHVTRLKNGKMSVHPIHERELRMIKSHRKDCKSKKYVFCTFQGNLLSETAIRLILNMVGSYSNITYRIHPHMFRHACGYYLANKGIDTRAIQEYLGHRDITKTVIYTEMAPHRFDNFWKD